MFLLYRELQDEQTKKIEILEQKLKELQEKMDAVMDMAEKQQAEAEVTALLDEISKYSTQFWNEAEQGN